MMTNSQPQYIYNTKKSVMKRILTIGLAYCFVNLVEAQSTSNEIFLSKPIITSPGPLDTVESAFTLEGTANPGASIEIFMVPVFTKTSEPLSAIRIMNTAPYRRQLLKATADATGKWQCPAEVRFYSNTTSRSIQLAVLQKLDNIASARSMLTLNVAPENQVAPVVKNKPVAPPGIPRDGSVAASQNGTTGSASAVDYSLTIAYPKANQKVRGDVTVRGTAKAGSEIEIIITSAYVPLKRDDKNRRFSAGDGKQARMNRKFRVKANAAGNWVMPAIDLRNRNWREEFTITAVSKTGKTSKQVMVYDDVRPVYFD